MRNGKKVRRVYVGAGEIARIAHERDVMSRAQEERRRQEERRAQERLEAL